MSKKGAIEVQFNWVMVLIIGALILLAFFGFSQKQKSISEIIIADDALTQLNMVLSGAKVSSDTANVIQVPKKKVEFLCDSLSCNSYGCSSSFRIGEGLTRSYNVHPIFSPDFLLGKSMTTWALDWSIPYRVSNLVFITNPEVKYILVYDADSEDFARNINNSLPERIFDVAGRKVFSFDLVDFDNFEKVTRKNNFKTRFVFLNLADENLRFISSTFANSDVSVLRILSENDFEIGIVEFYKKRGNLYESDQQYPFMGKATLFAAIFAEDGNIYSCNMKKALNSARIITDLNLDRISRIPEQTPICEAYYSQAEEVLNKIKNDLQLDQASFDRLNSYKEELEGINLNLQRQSCPTVY